MIALTFSNNKSKIQLGTTESGTFCRSCKLARAIRSFLGNTLKLDLELIKLDITDQFSSYPMVETGYQSSGKRATMLQGFPLISG